MQRERKRERGWKGEGEREGGAVRALTGSKCEQDSFVATIEPKKQQQKTARQGSRRVERSRRSRGRSRRAGSRGNRRRSSRRRSQDRRKEIISRIIRTTRSTAAPAVASPPPSPAPLAGPSQPSPKCWLTLLGHCRWRRRRLRCCGGAPKTIANAPDKKLETELKLRLKLELNLKLVTGKCWQVQVRLQL